MTLTVKVGSSARPSLVKANTDNKHGVDRPPLRLAQLLVPVAVQRCIAFDRLISQFAQGL
jgi:hypothetical protein